MITQERITNGNSEFILTRSDTYYIRGGDPEGDYTEAIDPVGANRTYTETDIPLPTPGDMEITDAEALAIITGTTGEGGTA